MAEGSAENVIEAFKNKVRDKLNPAIAANWKSFGRHLIGNDNTKKFLETQTKSCENCFEELIEHFLSSKRKWKEIFFALENIDKNNLSRKLKEKYEPDQTVDLDVSQLTIELKDISGRWKRFGRKLHIEENKLECIEQSVTNEELLDKILDHWFDICDPVERVEDLCKSLVIINKRKLAKEVRKLASNVGVDGNEVTSEMQQVKESREATDEQDELSDRLKGIRVSQTPLNKTTNVIVQPNDNEGSVGGVGTSEQVTDNHPQEDPVKVGKPVNVVPPEDSINQPVPSEGSVLGCDQPPELAAYSKPEQATSDEIFDKTSQMYGSPQQTASLT